MEVRAMEYRPIVPTGVAVPGIQDYHAAIPDLSPPRSQGSSTGGASSIGDYAPRMYTPPTPPTPHEDEKYRSVDDDEDDDDENDRHHLEFFFRLFIFSCLIFFSIT
ncbi:hypothetical protein PV328_004810 [Microctonus aethiopoides]|uniref:Uncharacterized protein n=1 Tax=Microctonus aethiopoides TaxID=144406 RepID=A0AA39FBK1_9HYME|nr:hypothetical protein PV328_004810 [Microctonus aethiopoides]